MSSVEPPVMSGYPCEKCGARSSSQQGKCWLCQQDRTRANPFRADLPAGTMDSTVGGTVSGTVSGSVDWSQQAANQADRSWDGLFNVLLGLIVALTVLVGIGFAVQDQGLLIPFAILIGPALLITFIRGFVASQSGGVRPGKLLLTLAVSFLVTVIIVILLTVAAAILLFITCLNSLSHP
jgi:hypothetical protein